MPEPRVSETYRKDTQHDPGHGYGRQVDNVWVAGRILAVSSVIVHTTNNPNKGTKIWNEATFLRDSPDVSCHALIGKDGAVYTILPDTMVAWHSGRCLEEFANSRSKGYEIHCSVGESPTQAQRDSLAWCVRRDIAKYRLVAADIETHRAVALPKGRKSDPEGWIDEQFYAWRDSLFAPVEPDYEQMWGAHYPRFTGSGIETAWRPHAAVLGAAVSDETGDQAGRVWRLFQSGAISFNPVTEETVVYVPRVR